MHRHHYNRKYRKNSHNYDPRRHTTPQLTLEIECVPKYTTAHKLREQLSDKYPTVHEDGSLPGYGAEIDISDNANTAPWTFARAAFDLHKHAKATSDCGLHCHIDARPLFANTAHHPRLASFHAWLAEHQDWFFSLIPQQRRHNSYCTRYTLRRNTTSSYYLPHAPAPYTDQRHTYLKPAFMSFRQHTQTIENRLHPGTLNTFKIYAWTLFNRDILRHLHSTKRFPPDPLKLAKHRAARAYLELRIATGGQPTRTEVHHLRSSL